MISLFKKYENMKLIQHNKLLFGRLSLKLWNILVWNNCQKSCKHSRWFIAVGIFFCQSTNFVFLLCQTMRVLLK